MLAEEDSPPSPREPSPVSIADRRRGGGETGAPPVERVRVSVWNLSLFACAAKVRAFDPSAPPAASGHGASVGGQTPRRTSTSPPSLAEPTVRSSLDGALRLVRVSQKRTESRGRGSRRTGTSIGEATKRRMRSNPTQTQPWAAPTPTGDRGQAQSSQSRAPSSGRPCRLILDARNSEARKTGIPDCSRRTKSTGFSVTTARTR